MAGDVRRSVQFLQRRCQFIFPFIFSDPDRSLDDDLMVLSLLWWLRSLIG